MTKLIEELHRVADEVGWQLDWPRGSHAIREGVARIEELREGLRAAITIIGHPDDATTQALKALLERADQ